MDNKTDMFTGENEMPVSDAECIEEDNKEVQGSIDAVICALSKDIVDTITGKKGFPCDGKEVVEKTQALASLVEASTCRCEKSVF